MLISTSFAAQTPRVLLLWVEQLEAVAEVALIWALPSSSFPPSEVAEVAEVRS